MRDYIVLPNNRTKKSGGEKPSINDYTITLNEHAPCVEAEDMSAHYVTW